MARARRTERQPPRRYVAALAAALQCAALALASASWAQDTPSAPAVGGGSDGGTASGGEGGVYLGPGAGGGVAYRDPVSGLPLSPAERGLPIIQPGVAGLGQYQGEFDIFEGGGVPGGGGAALAPGYTFTPSVTATLYGTDNAGQRANGSSYSSLAATLAPAIFATGNTGRLVGSLSYSPSFRYATNNDPNFNVYQFFNATGRLNVYEDRVYVTAVAFGSVNPVYGGTAPALNNAVVGATNSSNLVQTYGALVAPTAVQRFGDLATAQIGYTYRYSNQTGTTAFLPGSATPYFRSNENSTNSAYAAIRTGPAFSRWAFQAGAVTFESSGSGALGGSHGTRAVAEARYAITPQIAVSVDGGYDNETYKGTTPFKVEAPIWGVGARWNPNPDDFILFRYGQRNGYTSPYLLASWLLGSRTRLYANYIDSIGTPVFATLGLLAATGIDDLGNPIDTGAGVPIVPAPYVGGLLATQATLFRTKRGILTLTQGWERDTFSFNLSYTDSIPLTSAIGTTGFAQKGIYAGLGWTRALRENLSGNVFVSYGQTETDPQTGTSTVGSQRANYYSLRLALSQTFSPTLFGSISYIYQYNGNNSLFSQNNQQNIIIATLRKTF